ncbi:MAG: hypothetical protein L6R40_007264 [Gallowayella cf. fulva]|nr:MAG: hypothetical protein L6R40_007264 [Xanthomendoza cf. fulva]
MAPLSMLLTGLLVLTSTVFAALQPGPPFIRLDKSDAMVVVADLQEGLYQIVRDFDTVTYRNNMIAHAAIAGLFNLPIVLTTSAETGPNGLLPKEISSMYPSAPLIRRNGEVDAWDNSDFRSAVRAQNKSQIILAGITTDVCTEFLALSLRAEGYTVFANTEASGTFTDKLAADAKQRMKDGGVILQGMFAIVMDLMRDWRNTPGSLQVLPWLDTYLPAYGYVARGHEAAVQNGTLAPGEAGL